MSSAIYFYVLFYYAKYITMAYALVIITIYILIVYRNFPFVNVLGNLFIVDSMEVFAIINNGPDNTYKRCYIFLRFLHVSII